jgi:hypothetical protein
MFQNPRRQPTFGAPIRTPDRQKAEFDNPAQPGWTLPRSGGGP